MDAIRRHSLLIGGDWVDTDKRFGIRGPATEEPAASGIVRREPVGACAPGAGPSSERGSRGAGQSLS